MLGLLNKVKHLVKRSKTVNTQQDGDSFFNAQISYFGKSSVSEMYYPYGYAASPPTYSRGLTFNVLAQEENQVTLPYEPTTRFTGLSVGEVIVGNQEVNIYIKFLNSGTIEIQSTDGIIINGGDVTINDGNVTVSDGNIESSTGDVSDDSSSSPSMEDMRVIYNTHTHVGNSPPSQQM